MMTMHKHRFVIAKTLFVTKGMAAQLFSFERKNVFKASRLLVTDSACVSLGKCSP
jgi:hypothetical protein